MIDKQAGRSLAPEDGFDVALDRLQSQAMEIAPNSIYLYDLITQNICCYSENSVPTLLGYSDQHIEGLGPLGLAKIIYPADLQSVASHFQRLSVLAADEVISIEYRMKRSDGKWCLLRSHDTPLLQTANGLSLKVLSLVEDITNPKQSEMDLMNLPLTPI